MGDKFVLEVLNPRNAMKIEEPSGLAPGRDPNCHYFRKAGRQSVSGEAERTSGETASGNHG